MIRNVHTPIDGALKAYRLSEKKQPIGLNQVFYGENALSSKYINFGKFRDDVLEGSGGLPQLLHKHSRMQRRASVKDKCVSERLTFYLRNYNIRTLPNIKGKKEKAKSINHGDYTKNLASIINYVEFDY